MIISILTNNLHISIRYDKNRHEHGEIIKENGTASADIGIQVPRNEIFWYKVNAKYGRGCEKSRKKLRINDDGVFLHIENENKSKRFTTFTGRLDTI